MFWRTQNAQNILSKEGHLVTLINGKCGPPLSHNAAAKKIQDRQDS
jgi:hypothetical protein